MFPRGKITALIGISLGLLLIILLIGSRYILLASFSSIEEREARANVERVLNAVSVESARITTLALDYADWDDSYRFVREGNGEFIRKNLSDENFDKLGMNLIMYVDTGGKWVFARCFDLEKKTQAPFPDSLRAVLVHGTPLLRHRHLESAHAGLLALSEGILLISSVPILTSDYHGPIRGSLLMGRFLNSSEIRRIASITKLSLQFFTLKDARLNVPPAVFAAGGIPHLRITGAGTLSGFQLLTDVFGRPAVVVRVDTPRTTYRQGVRTVFYFVLWFAAFCILTAVLADLFGRKLVAINRKGEESGMRFRLLFENSLDAIIIGAPDGSILDANPEACRIFGRSADEIRQLGRDGLFDPSDHRFVAAQNILSTSGRFAGEVTAVRKDGTPFPADISSVVFRDSRGSEQMSSIIRDITGRKEAESELRESRGRYQAIVEGFEGLIYICDRDMRIEFMSRRLQERIGRDATGEICHEALFELGDICDWCDGGRVFQGETVQCEVQNPRDDRWYHVVSSPIAHGDGVISKQSMLTDITESKRAARERAELEAQLRQAQKMEAVGQLAGGVAHDFNNILSAVIGFGTLMEMAMKPDDPNRLHLEQILSATNRATQLIHGLLAFSRKQLIDLQPTDLNRVVRDIEKILVRLITEDIELRVLLADHDLTVLLDAGQIDQVLLNLVANARDAMPGGGELTIATGEGVLPPELHGTFGARPDARYALLTVGDSGSGMDSAIRERIFEPFFTTKEVGKGTGLGLSMVYGIVKQHNGFITVSSEKGHGTAFTIYLPLSQTRLPATETAESNPIDIHGTETVLVVEDDPAVRSLNRAILETFGYRVIEAVDGDDALDRFRSYRDDIRVIVMDVVMPKMNGRKTYAEICRIRPDVKVLFVSGYASDVLMDKGIGTDSFHFIPKPLKPLDLVKKIRAVLDS